MWVLLLRSHIRILVFLPVQQTPLSQAFLTIARSWNNTFPATFGMHGMSFSNLDRCPVEHPVNIFVGEGSVELVTFLITPFIFFQGMIGACWALTSTISRTNSHSSHFSRAFGYPE
ncbi:hypothetical protein B0H19DRAFT_1157139 [Mycena capillaripes]|nr:hypothetical protein B0H19DRAFT_1157139 [Mycena capillaripes]